MHLTNAQLAVILEMALGDELPLDAAGMSDLGVTSEDLSQARATLIADEVLVTNGDQRYGLAAPLAEMLAAAFAPEQLLVLQVQARDQAPSQISYSRSGSSWTRHAFKDPDGHEFTALTTAGAVADSLLEDTRVAARRSGVAPAERAPLVDVLRRAVSLGLLATGPLPGRDTPPAALSWIAASDGVWWVNPAGPPETAQRCTSSDLKDKIVDMIGRS